MMVILSLDELYDSTNTPPHSGFRNTTEYHRNIACTRAKMQYRAKLANNRPRGGSAGRVWKVPPVYDNQYKYNATYAIQPYDQPLYS